MLKSKHNISLYGLFSLFSYFIFCILFFLSSYYFCLSYISFFCYFLIIFLLTYRFIGNTKYKLFTTFFITSFSFFVVNYILFLTKKVPVTTPYSIFDELIICKMQELCATHFIPILGSFLLAMLTGLLLSKIYIKYENIFITVFLLFSIFNFIMISLTYDPYPLKYAREIIPKEKCVHDTQKFMLVFHKMKEGKNYYSCLGEDEHKLENIKRTNIIYWRLPTLISVWSFILPNDGAYVIYLYLLLSAINAAVFYKVIRKIAGSALSLLGVQFLLSYYLKGIICIWFTCYEIWGGFFIVIALYEIMRGEFRRTLIFIMIAVFIRELYIITLLIFIIYLYLIKEKKTLNYSILSLLAFLAYYASHFYFTFQYLKSVGISLGVSVEGRLHHNNHMLLQTLEFGSSLFVGYLWTMISILALSILGFFHIDIEQSKKLLLAGFIFIPMGMFLFMGSPDNDYWGGIYLPVIFLMAPFGIQFLTDINKEKEAAFNQASSIGSVV